MQYIFIGRCSIYSSGDAVYITFGGVLDSLAFIISVRLCFRTNKRPYFISLFSGEIAVILQ